ncbi:DoxX family protein [Photobacterium chitinilyticum]|uniref:DoxX family protein n=1 Tax=Photobacterium chitinilyticum TaxID=2485123 RepID=A0A3S3UI68_9GAMM|nr:DoxX family protein [Photobacterium chitinilyticum]RWX54554.1 DoxX family protein [Photobacterium chitinilyticum]
MNTFLTVVIALLSAFFLFASSIKLFGWQKMIFDKQLVFFHSYGLNRQVMVVVGLAELFGGLAIWFQSSLFGTLGALALLGTSLGAIICHLRFDTWKDGIPAMITLSLSSMIVYFSLQGASWL